MHDLLCDADAVGFAAPSPETDELLRQGVAAYRNDRTEADRLFREAVAQAPHELAAYFCLYKIHCYMGQLDVAADFAIAGMREAAQQAGWDEDPRQWPPQNAASAGPQRFALFTLKALSFIELRRGNKENALNCHGMLEMADPSNSVGWSVIDVLAQGAM